MVSRRSTGLAGALFPQVQLRVLGLFFGQPSQVFQLTQVIKLAGSGRGAVQREVEKLVRVGILAASRVAGRNVYQANPQCPIFDELRGLILKTVGLLDPLRKSLKVFTPKIIVAFVYGSVAKGEDTAKSDIDLMIIGHDIAYSDIFTALQRVEKELMRPINPTLMSPVEWNAKLSDKNHFVLTIEQQPKMFVFGTDDELKRVG